MALEIPFLSRLHITEYFALLLSIVLIALESFIAVITLALPTPIINFCYRITRRLFNHLSSPSSRRSRQKKKGVWSSIANASDFTELCELYGYYAEEHIVQTGDGYLLGVHRLGWRRGEEDVKVNAGPGKGGVKKKVVYMHHGLMMNSEVWVCLTDRERCLPFELVERGYDVWVSLPGWHLCPLHLVYGFLHRGYRLTPQSWAITEGTSTPKSPCIHLQLRPPFGTSQWINSHFTTSLTR
jgi:lysosomal acid lipase/cholesteryl ester hydrolase